MGYKFKIEKYYQVKVEGEYPWACISSPNRTIKLYTDDVLTKSEDGTYMKHTGLGCFGIVLKDDEVVFCDKTAHLQMI